MDLKIVNENYDDLKKRNDIIYSNTEVTKILNELISK